MTDGVNSRFVTVDIVVEPLTVTEATLEIGGETEVGLLGNLNMAGPYVVIFDRDLDGNFGELWTDFGSDKAYFESPSRPKRRRLKIPYSVYSMTTNVTSPDYGRWVRGMLRLKMVRRLP